MSTHRITLRQEKGQTMAEYAVVLGVVTLAIVAAFSLLARAIQSAFERVVALVGLAV